MAVADGVKRLSQANRAVTLAIDGVNSLGDDALFVVTALSLRETLGQPFELELTLASTEPERVDAERILGREGVVRIRVAEHDGETLWRPLHGFVDELERAGAGSLGIGRVTRYRMRLVPFVALLRHAWACRPWSGTAADIAADVAAEHGFDGLIRVDQLAGAADLIAWDWRVQYDEDAGTFIARLLEDEGLSYYFEHKPAGHEAVLMDDVRLHPRGFVPIRSDDGEGGVLLERLEPLAGTEVSETDSLNRPLLLAWRRRQRVVTGELAASGYDETKAEVVKASLSAGHTHDHGQLRRQLYPEKFLASDPKEQDGKPQALERVLRRRLEGLGAARDVFSGETNALWIAAGREYKLGDVPAVGNTTAVVITSAVLTCRLDAGPRGDGFHGRVEFEAVSTAAPYAPPRRAARPRLVGAQTATVHSASAAADRNVETDDLARVKLVFPWDETGTPSPWVRVSQPWAGKRWGAQMLPHKGDELIVEFLDGDPDRPIVVGRVYNDRHRPPELQVNGGPAKLVGTNLSMVLADERGNYLHFENHASESRVVLHNPEAGNALEMNRDGIKMMSNKKFTNACQSDSSWITLGRAWSGHFGEKYSLTMGLQAGLTVGASFTAKLSAELTATAGAFVGFTNADKVEVSRASTYSYAQESKYTWTSGDLSLSSAEHAAMLSGHKKVKVVGGPMSQSTIEADDKKLKLTFGQGPPNGGPVDSQFGKRLAAMGAVTLATASSAVAATVGIANKWKSDNAVRKAQHPYDELSDAEMWGGIVPSIATGVAATAGYIALSKSLHAKKEAEINGPPPVATTALELTRQKAALNALAVRLELASGNAELTAPKEINLSGKLGVKIDSPAMVQVKGSMIKIG